METKTVKTYITFDGKEFSNEKEAKNHEEMVLLSLEEIKKESEEYKNYLRTVVKSIVLQVLGQTLTSTNDSKLTVEVPRNYDDKKLRLISGYDLAILGKRINLYLEKIGMKLCYYSDCEGRYTRVYVESIGAEYFDILMKHFDLVTELNQIDNWLK